VRAQRADVVGQHRAEHRDAQRAADLAGGVVDRRRHALLVGGQRGDDRGDRQAGRDQQQAHGTDAPHADARDQPRHARGDRDHRHRGGRQRGAGLQRRVAQHELQVLQHDEDRSEHREELDEDRQRAGREAALGEQARVEHRLGGAPLIGHERGQSPGPWGEFGTESSPDRA
jgi:hypothetical protein